MKFYTVVIVLSSGIEVETIRFTGQTLRDSFLLAGKWIVHPHCQETKIEVEPA